MTWLPFLYLGLYFLVAVLLSAAFGWQVGLIMVVILIIAFISMSIYQEVKDKRERDDYI